MADHFTITNYWYTIEGDTVYIIVITDVPCHIWMRYTLVEPQKHLESVVRRGLIKADDPYYCFVAGRDNEQEEPGDTLIHTFYKPEWPFCQTRWFYFWGTIDGVESPSATGIFTLHNDGSATLLSTGWLENEASNRTLRYSWGTWRRTHDFPTGTILTLHGPPDHLLYARASLSASFWAYRSFIRFNTTAIPVGSTILRAVLSYWCQDKAITSSLGRPYIQITQGVQATPIVPANYGDQLPYTVVGGQVDIRDIVISARNEIVFNSDGLPFITPGGVTRLCLRSQLDVEDSSPPFGINALVYHSRTAPAYRRTWLKVFYYP